VVALSTRKIPSTARLLVRKAQSRTSGLYSSFKIQPELHQPDEKTCDDKGNKALGGPGTLTMDVPKFIYKNNIYGYRYLYRYFFTSYIVVV